MKAREFSREFKATAVKRMLAGQAASRLAKGLGVRRKLFYEWKQRMEQGRTESAFAARASW